MIHRTAATWQTLEWQKALADAFTCPKELFEYLQLNKTSLPAALRSAQQFGLRVPRDFAALMKKGDPKDPLLLQVLPQADELNVSPGYSEDPVGDLSHQATTGLLHKYHGRALIIASESCGVNCRFCFRRHFPYSTTSARQSTRTDLLKYLEETPDIDEVILSGGDPLVLEDQKLRTLAQQLKTIKHLKRLRIHSRIPVVIPQRVNPEFISWFSQCGLQPILVLHINHPKEISPKLIESFFTLRQAGVSLLSQTVLLKGVNDHHEPLSQLFSRLFESGVQPYYLHVLDPVQGAAHFDLPDSEAKEIHKALRVRLPGYMVPKLVREISGEMAKTLIL